MTEPIDCIIIDGTPMAYIVPIICASGLNLWKSSLISWLNLWLHVPATMAATHWPITVATAAPVTPILGQPKRPNIIIGSRIIFVIASHSCDVMLNMVRPVDVNRRSKKICASSPKENIITVLKYSIPYSIICTSAFPIWLL